MRLAAAFAYLFVISLSVSYVFHPLRIAHAAQRCAA